ncbi:MAG TPA: serine hydrolase [Gemmataceae bacterium]|nr:serine hydrolase [Gemmataceae bacterium]
MRASAVILTLVFTATPLSAEEVWPGKDWETATPASQGLSATGLDEAAAYAEMHGGGSGCVIRHGRLVKEWGPVAMRWDIKSATKGTLGSTLLGLAVDAKLVKLDDLAQKHYPTIGTEFPANDKDWLGEITVRHLATMTAGFDDGRPPKLVYRPGTKGIYSNDTSNMLAELLTLRYGEDLAAVLKREVMDPIGMPADDWRWRTNQFRPKEVGGITSREFASGLTITHRGLARIGYLYLREGRWKDKQILSREYVKTATTPTKLPAPWPFYAFYWGSNANGSYPDMPKDTFWALGLGDSFVVVCPSLALVAVRTGLGNVKSQLPGGDDWGKRVEGFFRLIVRSVKDAPPPSPVIRDVRWAPADTIIRLAKGSDNWPTTWGDDDAIYTAYGDGWGFDPRVPDKLSLGFAKITGTPPDIAGVNIRSVTGEQKGDGKAGKKASGLLMVNGVLYMWVRNAGNTQLAWSKDRGKTWEWANWTVSTSFGCPTFLNYGKDYAGARDNFVYVYSPDADGAYDPADRMNLARVPKDRIRERDAYEFFRGAESPGRPLWSKDVADRGAVLSDPGRCYRSMVSYNAGLKRYLWCVTLPSKEKKGTYGLTIYDAPEPWGPWTTAYRAEVWDTDAGESCGFPTKWMSPDGKTLHLVFASGDAFCVRKAELVLHDPKKP